jgi:hypothetical protein
MQLSQSVLVIELYYWDQMAVGKLRAFLLIILFY